MTARVAKDSQGQLGLFTDESLYAEYRDYQRLRLPGIFKPA